MTPNRVAAVFVLVGCFMERGGTTFAWWSESHATISLASADALPKEVPAFFRQSGEALAFHSVQPDLWKNPELPHLRDAEGPEHFLNGELLDGRALPPFRWEFVALCGQLKKNPRDVGLLPYAIVEWTERLTLAFAAYRAEPDNRNVREECLLYGGILSHYAADLAQPLHLTIDYDGRTAPGQPSPHTGIHNRMDALIEALNPLPRELAREVRPGAIDDLFSSITQHIMLERNQIDRVYGLEKDLPPTRAEQGVEAGWKPTDDVRRFGEERAREAAYLTASCWLTAWEKSQAIKPHLPLRHEALEPAAPPGSRRTAWIAVAVMGVLLVWGVLRLVRRATGG